MSDNTHIRQSQKGFVSIFTLMFFIILASVFTVGFMRIVLDEAQQAIYNSATNSALAAARAGIEDGKRAIILYKALVDGATDPGGLKNELENAFSSNECDSLYGNKKIRDALGLNEFGKIETTNLDEQAYTCLTAKGNTTTYETQASPSKSAIVPLSGVSSFNNIVVRWHKLALDGTPTGATEVTGQTNPNTSSFPNIPTFMRLQLIRAPDTGRVDAIESYTGFLRTSTATTTKPDPKDYFMKDLDYTTPAKAPGKAPCVIAGFDYSCEVQMHLPPWIGTPPNVSYYLRITPLYKQTHVQVELRNGKEGSAVEFAMVQPEVDATGKSGDTLRRLKARVKFTSDVALPEYVVEAIDPIDPAKGTICKSFTVSAIAGPLGEPHGDCQLP